MSTEFPAVPALTEPADGVGTASDALETTPGTRIRNARERAKMSLDDLAMQTKLAKPTLDALERDDYNALLEPVYVRGYYRKCAKVLGIDEEPLIRAYSARVVEKSPVAPSKLRLASGTELGSSSRLPVAMAVLAAVVAVVACAFLWLARDETKTYPTAPMTSDAMGVNTSDLTTQSVPADSVEVVGADTSSGAADATTPIESAASTADGAEVAPASPAAEPAAASTTSASSEPGTLSLTFSESSWVRVDDAAGKTLLNGTKQAGEQININGALPLNVFLGNAPGVRVEYEGRVFDTGAFTRSNKTARFGVPQS
ncbi:helix-turn-helix domain-containing protein [Sinimarinibacterium sp. CAU 1509]|uniref:helix-turn-helix domain-containing protein n=1 Tax=Sinimarinibacterium sp. CAU 1509 TaxID=2562283 RepID=UPI0010AC755D|nr:RodZ domain-containing protein [Sinimarinibacterium sp. CAU 1509]TJY61977.1 helix-turn-helix domain-containing protein [Sinimarinibacterium sp. CAU 1509]